MLKMWLRIALGTLIHPPLICAPCNVLCSSHSVDTQGRVIRLDTFSKTVAPGVRLGWFTCNPLFAERLERHGETSTQAPCGLGQSLVTKLLLIWKYDGYVRWLRGLRIQYGLRRDLFIDILNEEFDLSASVGSASVGAWSGQTVYTAYAKPKPTSLFGSAMGMMSEKRALLESRSRSQSKRLLSFVAPSSGMFVWVSRSSFPRCLTTELSYPILPSLARTD